MDKKNNQTVLEIINKTNEQIIKGIEPALKQLSEYINSINDSITKSMEGIRLSLETFAEILQSHSLTPESKAFYKKKAKNYALFGMTYPIGDSINAQLPEMNEQLANNLCDTYSTGQYFEELKTGLANLKHCKKQLVEEAIKCFENENYYATCSLLFQMIDCEILRSQKNNDKKDYMRDKFRRLINNPEEKRFDFDYFCSRNLIFLFDYYYQGGNNFISEDYEKYPLINRNFVCHGMTSRKITKNDCIKLMFFIWHLSKISILNF